MSALTIPQSSTAIKQTLAGLSPGLKSLLGVEPSNLRAVSEIASNPALLAEAKTFLPVIHANATIAASREEIIRMVAAKFVTYRQPERSDAEWAVFWDDHCTVLADVSATALESALDACLADPKIEFLPKPAKLRELARLTPNRAVRAYDRAKAAIEARPASPIERLSPDKIAEMVAPLANRPRVEPSAADKERVRQQMREYIAADDAKKAAKKSASCDMKSTAGTTDETGITPQMRAIIQARNSPQNGANT